MSSLIETDFTLEAPDGKTIYGILTKANEQPSDKVVVIAHGLTGHMCEYIHMMARKFFAERGYDVVRMSFYDCRENARKLEETTVAIHADDFNIVCNHFRPQYKKLYCAGHSYGGTTVLLANPKANALSFWDGTTYPLSMHWKDRKKLSGTPYYTCGWGTTNLISEDMYNEAFELDTKACAKAIETPSQVILAGENVENEPRDILHQLLTCDKSIEDIKGADHCFNNGNTLETLLTKTHEWFEKY